LSRVKAAIFANALPFRVAPASSPMDVKAIRLAGLK
jgi:hypothetical protein